MAADGDDYWAWREAQLKHPDGRATGGEPCVVCGGPIPAGAHWQHRDRHMCGPRCNATSNRRFVRARGRTPQTTPPPAVTDPYDDRPPRVFGMAPGGADFPYEFLGFSPRVGDVVVRHGSTTCYQRMSFTAAERAHIEALAEEDTDPEMAAYRRRVLRRGGVAIHVETGSTQMTLISESGTFERTVLATTAPDGSPHSTMAPFTHDGKQWVWGWESFRHVEPDGSDYTWEAAVCLPFPIPPGLAQPSWTLSYTARSEKRARISASTAGHARRVRMVGPDGKVERMDPQEVFASDGWTCQLCQQPVDPQLRAPDPGSASLDHRIPLSAGGSHARSNVQASHLICNIRKGARG